jgi:hypothetical protein
MHFVLRAKYEHELEIPAHIRPIEPLKSDLLDDRFDRSPDPVRWISVFGYGAIVVAAVAMITIFSLLIWG